MNYVLYRSGERPIREILSDNPLAQDYVHWGLPGRGRWVTIYATDAPTPHVFVVIAGLRLDTSHNGTDVGPNRLQDGPRWRVLDPVSYTHLTRADPTWETAIVSAVDRVVIRAREATCLEAVSYTHLDVYKRQHRVKGHLVADLLRNVVEIATVALGEDHFGQPRGVRGQRLLLESADRQHAARCV